MSSQDTLGNYYPKQKEPLFPIMISHVPNGITKEDLEDIIKRLDRIEKGIKELTGIQLINRIWR